MKYNNYLKDGSKVSEIGFGSWQLGKSLAWSEIGHKESIALVHEALDLGINFFDTAPNYGKGSSERTLGEALKGRRRDSFVLSTKFGHTVDGVINFSADNVRTSVEGSLKRLQTDYIDSVLIHSPDRKYIDGTVTDHYRVLEDLKREGKILGYGASLDNSSDMVSYINNSDGEIIEAFFNIIHQDCKYAFELAKEKGIKIIAKIPLDSGWLSGKYNKNSSFNGVRDRWSPDVIRSRADVVEKIDNIKRSGQTLAQFALGFCLAYDSVTTVIPGNKNSNQLNNNAESINYPLSPQTLIELEKLYIEDIKGLKLPW